MGWVDKERLKSPRRGGALPDNGGATGRLVLAIIGDETGEPCVHNNPKDESGDDNNGMLFNNEDEGRTPNWSELTAGPPMRESWSEMVESHLGC